MSTSRKKKENNTTNKKNSCAASKDKKLLPGNPSKELVKLFEELTIEKYIACYIRVSTDAQAEKGYSIPEQKTRLEGFCQSKGWDNVKYYIDPGFSGSNLNRPAMTELISDVGDGKIKAVVVFKLDRLSRSQKDTLYLIEDVFLPNDVDFISLSESLDTGSPFGRAMIGILSVFAQLERENIYMRTRIGMQGRVSAGYWRGGGGIPFGYNYDKNLKTLVRNEDSDKVPKIFELYLKGYSCQKIADMFGIKNDVSVYQMLSRRTYCGYVSYKGQEYPGIHEPLIDEETFRRTAIAMEQRGKKNIGVSGANRYFLLTGLLYCGDCGARMRYMMWGKEYKVVCYSHNSKKHMVKDENCPNYGVWAKELDDLVVSKLFELSYDIDSGKECREMIDPVKELESQLNQTTLKLKRLYSLFAESPEQVLLEQVMAQRDRIESLKKQLEIEKKDHRKEAQMAHAREQIKNIGAVWENLTPMEKQNFIRDCVEKVVVYHDGRVEIFYSFKTADKAEKEGA